MARPQLPQPMRPHAGPRAGAHALFCRMRDFRRDESGSIAVLVLFFFFTMLLLGGIAIDVMRFENHRVAVQNTLDRATLAAANLDQPLYPQPVVADYFAKAGLSDTLRGVQDEHTFNFKRVSAQAEAISPNLFMDMLNVTHLRSLISSTAEQRIVDIEIMLVLDISGSMQGNKLTNLKAAANEFVDTIKRNDLYNRISIGVVPYNAQVNIGNDLYRYFNVSHVHNVNNARCIEFPSSVYNSVALSRTISLPMMAYADVVSGTTTSNEWIAPPTPTNSAANRWCNRTTTNQITLPTRDPQTVKTAVNALTAQGNTSILVGMRWATAMLDPSMRDVYDALVVPRESGMAGRPFAYDASQTMKVIVLMTDGEHVAHNRITDAYKTGTSPIWYDAQDDRYSIRHTVSGSTRWWVPHRSAWQTTPWGNNRAVQLDWSQVWENLPPTWVAWQLYARALGTSNNNRTTTYNNQIAAMRTTYQSNTSMDSLLRSNCEAARTLGMLVYGIAFEAPASGQTAIRNCASDPKSNFYFSASGIEISQVFRLIATNLSQLRLTQ